MTQSQLEGHLSSMTTSEIQVYVHAKLLKVAQREAFAGEIQGQAREGLVRAAVRVLGSGR